MTRFSTRIASVLSILSLGIASPALAGGWLGITVQTPEGVQIGEILKDGPADKAGLARNDILIKADGKPITSLPHFLTVVENATPDKELRLTVVRKGEEKEIKIIPDDSNNHPSRFPEGRPVEPLESNSGKIWHRSEPWPASPPFPPPNSLQDPGREPPPGALPPPAPIPESPPPQAATPPGRSEGHQPPPLSEPALRERAAPAAEPPEPPPTAWMGVAPELSTHGVVLTRVAPGGPGEKAGMKAGDMIISLNGQSVSSPRAMARILRGFRPGDLIEVTLNRNGQLIDSQAQLAAPPATQHPDADPVRGTP
ncbi:MAG: PDZ domain-containing protein [Magnetococcales bacterium]|nr:PDZ domain-containing protein [Magnetococcales bacterium]